MFYINATSMFRSQVNLLSCVHSKQNYVHMLFNLDNLTLKIKAFEQDGLIKVESSLP